VYSPTSHSVGFKDSTDESDEVPLLKSLASNSKGKALLTQRRKGTQPEDEDEDELPRAHGEMRQKARRPGGAPGTSTATRARPANPILKNKRRRLSSPESRNDEVSRWHGQPQGLQTHIFSMKFPNRPPTKFSKTSQPSITTTVSRHYCISVGVIEFLLASHTTP